MGIEIRSGVISVTAGRKAGSWDAVRFNPPFASGATVAVVAKTQTYNGIETPNLRIRNVTIQGFELRFDEVYYLDATTGQVSSADGVHSAEDVGWIAMA